MVFLFQSIKTLVAMTTFRFPRIIMEKVEIWQFFCLNRVFWILFTKMFSE